MLANYIHVCNPPGFFIGHTRLRGFRRWKTVTGRCRTPEAALSRAVSTMKFHHHRARALWVGTRGSYYDPHVCIEAHR